MKSSDDAMFTISVGEERFTIDDGRFILDPRILPAICPGCGEDGTESQRVRIKAPYDWNFWFAIGGLIGVPVIFGISVAFVYWIFGNDAVQEFVPYGALVAIVLAAFGGFRMATSNRENWFLTFYFCNACSQQFKHLRFVNRLLISGVLVLLLAMMVLGVAGSALKLEPDTIQVLAWILLVSVFFGIAGDVVYRVRMARFRGLSVRWLTRRAELTVVFKNAVIAEAMKSRLLSGNSGGISSSDEPKDNDAIYKKLKQVAIEDGVATLDSSGREIQLLGRLSVLTQERFLEMIEPFMTPERARYVRKLRVDDGLSWRGVAEAWENEFAGVADWNFHGNQLAGMALCEAASKLFAENYMETPWN